MCLNKIINYTIDNNEENITNENYNFFYFLNENNSINLSIEFNSTNEFILNKFNYDNFLFNLTVNKRLEIFIEEENILNIQLFPILQNQEILYTIFILDEIYEEKMKDNCFIYKLKNSLISINEFYKIYQIKDISNITKKNLTIEISGLEINKKYIMGIISQQLNNDNEYIFYYNSLHFSYRINKKIFVDSNLKNYYLLYEKFDFYINETSFKNKDDKIILYSNREDIIEFKGDIKHDLPYRTKTFLIDYNILNKFPLIEFTISGNQIEDFYFEIQYSLNNDVNIEYLEDFKFYKMNDCSKKIILF